MDRRIIDARGLSCPQPAAMAKQALATAGEKPVEVLVNSASARDNVARAARLARWQVTIDESTAGEYRLVLAR